MAGTAAIPARLTLRGWVRRRDTVEELQIATAAWGVPRSKNAEPSALMSGQACASQLRHPKNGSAVSRPDT